MRQIAPQVFDPDERPRIAVPVRRERRATQRAPRGETRVLRGHAAAPILVLEERKVRLQLAGKVASAAVAAQQRVPPSEQETAHGRQGSPGNSLSMRPSSRRHLAVCFSSAFVPVLVML